MLAESKMREEREAGQRARVDISEAVKKLLLAAAYTSGFGAEVTVCVSKDQRCQFYSYPAPKLELGDAIRKVCLLNSSVPTDEIRCEMFVPIDEDIDPVHSDEWISPSDVKCERTDHDCEMSTDSADLSKEQPGECEEESLREWVLNGLPIKSIHQKWKEKFKKTASRRTLERTLHKYNIKHADDVNISDEQVVEAIEKENALGVYNYHKLYSTLRRKYKLAVTRERVVSLMRKHQLLKSRNFKKEERSVCAAPFISRGPNYLWSVIGAQKQTLPFGIYIYGIIDIFSRRLLALNALPSDTPESVFSWFHGQANEIGGLPNTMVMESDALINLNDSVSIIQMTSDVNLTIHSFWDKLQEHSAMKWFVGTFRGLENEGQFAKVYDMDRWIIWKVFAQLVQSFLDEYRETYNANNLHKERGVSLPCGYSPNEIWQHASLFDVEDHLQPLDDTQKTATQIELKEFELPYDLDQPATKENARDVYIKIRDFLRSSNSVWDIE